MDLRALTKVPSWFNIWISKFGPEIQYLPSYINQKYKIFAQRADTPLGNPFNLFLSYFKIPWLLSWSYGIKYYDFDNTPLSQVWFKKFILDGRIGFIHQ